MPTTGINTVTVDDHTQSPAPTPAGGAVPTSQPTTSAFNVDKAVGYLDQHGTPRYLKGINGHCGTAIRKAIGAGGLTIPLTPSAQDFGPPLIKAGFTKVDIGGTQPYTPKRGDVVIYPAWGKHTDGHIQMYDGKQWVSDFRQHGGDGLIPGNDPGWKKQPYTVYRTP